MQFESHRGIHIKWGTILYGIISRAFRKREKPYTGNYRSQKRITPKKINNIRQRRGYALTEVIKNMQTIAQDIGTLKGAMIKLTSRTDKYMMIFVSSFAALVIAIIVKMFVFP